jgi:transcriptional regulator with XRE-family HTH domain
MAWIGRDLEHLRKLRGLRREDLAAQLPEPVSPSTIRNIEHDENYNVSLDLLRKIAQVLGAEVKISLETAAESQGLEIPLGSRVVSNDYFIRYIRARFPGCPLTNSQIGRRMWSFAESHGAQLLKERKQIRRVIDPAAGTTLYPSPTTAAEYQVSEKTFAALERFADRLGRAYSDGKGGVLVPAA